MLNNEHNYFTILEILRGNINSIFTKNFEIILIFINSNLNYDDISDDLHLFNFYHKFIDYFVLDCYAFDLLVLFLILKVILVRYDNAIIMLCHFEYYFII